MNPMWTRAWRSGIAAVLVAAASCGDSRRPPPPLVLIDAPPPTVLPDLVAPLVPATVTLLEPGAEPRRPRRYDYDVNRMLGLELELAWTTTEGPGGASTPPAVLVRFEPAAKARTGELTPVILTAELVSARDVEGGVAPASTLAQATAELRGASIRFELDDRGVARTRHADGPLGNHRHPLWATIAPGLDQLWLPLPAEDIGVGARWTVHEVRWYGGALVTIESTYQLDAVDGSGLSVRGERRLTGRPQRLETGSAPVEVSDIEGTGAIDAQVLLGRGEVRATGTLALSQTMTTMGQTIRVGSQLRFTITPR